MDKSTPLIKTLKEVGRYVVSGITAWLLTEGVVAGLVLLLGQKFKIDDNAQAIIVIVMTNVIRAIDKYVHESPTIKADGVIPF